LCFVLVTASDVAINPLDMQSSGNDMDSDDDDNISNDGDGSDDMDEDVMKMVVANQGHQ